jgi:3D (Asp-Asp-Asp) domain-containing protein
VQHVAQVAYPKNAVLGFHIRMNKPYLKTIQNLVAISSIGLSHYPGLPGQTDASQLLNQSHTERVEPLFLQPTLAPNQPILEVQWISVKATSYCWQEPDHLPFGRHNCMGGDLTKLVQGLHQCAADLKWYPLGTILDIKTSRGEEIRIVTDCGKDVRGPYHIDLHFDSLPEMNARGTRKALIQILRRGWTGYSQTNL